MKKVISALTVLLFLAVSFTGCVKFRETLKMDESGLLTITILTAVSPELTEEEIDTTKEVFDFSDMENMEGVTAEKYTDEEGYVGKIITVNIDPLAKGEDENVVIPTEVGEVEVSDVNVFVLTGDKVILTLNTSYGDELDGIDNYEEQLADSGVVLELVVDFPFAALSSNATVVSEDNKVLTWDLINEHERYAVYAKEDFEKYFGTENYSLINPFEDVLFGTYYHDSVLWAYQNGITTGTSATKFSPDATCTRGQVVTFLWRAMGEPEPSTDVNPFGDVKESDYYYKAVLWAVENGITNGTSAKAFSPAKTCSNAHILTFIYRAFGEPDKTGEGEWYEDAVLWSDTYGLTEDTYADTFDSSLPCPRKDVVTFLFRAVSSGSVAAE